MTAKYAIGIDLGTTNSVLAYVLLNEESPNVELLPIWQLTAPSQVEALPSLPSFVYLAQRDFADLPSLSLDAAFGKSPYTQAHNISPERIVVGQYARVAAADAPEQVVVAAKSWLCHDQIDRHAAILPWNANSDVDLISPVDASRLILQHLVAAWHAAFPNDPMERQNVALTVPASFDLAARELTFEAAAEAGLPADLIALEEPQAAVYHWINRAGKDWRNSLQANDQLLVCDVGGGTTDLALLQVDQSDGEVELRRVAVGRHLLVGGDNMDLALAHFAAGKFAQAGHKLNPWQTLSLWHSARNAKESLLSGSQQEEYTISVLGRGSRLIGGTVAIALTAAEVEQTLVDGFFPRCDLQDTTLQNTSSGFQEIGLPFETDTAITRHVAVFLSSQPDAIKNLPNRILFNGGVFKSAVLRQRMLEIFQQFSAENSEESSSESQSNSDPSVLGGMDDLDASVACGAAYYSWSKANGGVRIRGGTARSYYVGIETAGLAVPGMPRPLTALCVVPKGMEEGTQAEVPSRDIGLVVGQEASFRFFSALQRPQDRPGTTLKFWDEEELHETAPMQMNLPANQVEQAEQPPIIRVRFVSKITELGIFELWCTARTSDQSWKLEMNVRN